MKFSGRASLGRLWRDQAVRPGGWGRAAALSPGWGAAPGGGEGCSLPRRLQDALTWSGVGMLVSTNGLPCTVYHSAVNRLPSALSPVVPKDFMTLIVHNCSSTVPGL